MRCGTQVARPRWVPLGGGETRVVLDPELESRQSAIDDAFRLRYDSTDGLTAQARADAATLARIHDARGGYLLVDGALHRMDRAEDGTVRWVARGGLHGGALEAIAAATRDDGSGGGGGSGGGPDGLFLAGLTIGIVGLGATVSAWGVGAEWQARADWARAALPGDPDFQLRQDRRDEMVLPIYLLGAGGALLLGVGSTLAVDGVGDVPIWAWVIGGLGVAAAAVGAAVWSTEGQCSDAMCTTLQLGGEPFGPLLIMNGASLMWVPFAWLLRSAVGPSASPMFSAVSPVIAPDFMGLSARGAF